MLYQFKLKSCLYTQTDKDMSAIATLDQFELTKVINFRNCFRENRSSKANKYLMNVKLNVFLTDEDDACCNPPKQKHNYEKMFNGRFTNGKAITSTVDEELGQHN